MIAAINRVEVAGTNWTVILAHDGIISFLKLVTSDACNIIDEVNLKMKISLNADSLEVNKNLILVKFNNGLFKLYQVDEHEIKSRDGDVVSSVKMSHRKTWNLTEQIKTEFGDEYICQMGNISRMNYKNREFFCTIVDIYNDATDGGDFLLQAIVYFPIDSDKVIFYETKKHEKDAKPGSPLIMGNLVSGAADDDRFSCITEKSHLSVSLYTDEASSGPALSSFLGRGPNGTIKLVNKDEKCTKSDELSSIIGISRLDVLKDGNEEVVICNANGLTHIVSTKINQDIIRYHHKKGIRYFTSGVFGDKPCFVYLTCWNHLQVFRSVQLPWLSSKGILERVERNLIVAAYFNQEQCHTNEQKRELMKKLLYS